MDQPLPTNTWVMFLIGQLALASIGAWVWIGIRLAHGLPVLAQAPRRPVPWGGWATCLALAMVALAVLGLASPEEVVVEELSASEMVQRIGLSMLIILALTTVFLGTTMATSGATWSDLGLPDSVGGLARDVGIGAAAFLVALVPVYGVQAALVYGLETPSEHPLITMILSEPNPLLLGVAILSAVVIAPICEEVSFRLLLQGWLEKWACGEREATSDERGEEGEELGVVGEERIARNEADSDGDLALIDARYSLLAVLASAALFAIAHVGHGPDPIPLFLLAMILGYVYQRTHRIVPCIVMHMLFNGFSLGVLLVMIFSQE